VLAKSAQRELFLAAYPRSSIPDAFLLSAAVLAVVSLVVSALTERLNLVPLMRWLLLGGAGLLGLAFVTVHVWQAGGPMTAYVTVEVLMSVLLSQAWGVASEAVDVRSAKRLLPLVGLGAGLAWTAGGFAVSGLARWLGASTLLLLAAGSLLGALSLLQLVARHDLRVERRRAAAEPFFIGLASGLKAVFTEPLARVLAVLITVELVVEKLTDFQLFALAQQRFVGQPGGVAAFMGLFFGVTGAITLLAPLVSGRLLTSFGSTRVLVAGQVWLLLGALAFLAFPLFGVVVVLTGGDRVIKQALTAPARSQIFGALPAKRRAQAGALLRGVLAALFGALAALVLKALPSSLPVQYLSLGAAVLLVGLVVLTARTLRQAYLAALQRSVDTSQLDLDGPGAKRPLYREQLVMLEAELSSSDEGRAVLAVSVLRAGEPSTTRPLLHRALSHPSAEVRALAVVTLGQAGNPDDVELVLATLTAAREDEVRAACLEALAELKAVAALPALTPLCAASAPSVRALARVCRARLLEVAGTPGADTELSTIEAMLSSGNEDERRAAAWAIGRIPLHSDELRARFTPLLGDGSLDVRRAAIGASAQFADEGILRQLVSALEEPAIQAAAFEAFTRLNDEGVTSVEKVLHGAPPGLVVRAAAAFAQGSGERATDVLQRWLDHEAPQVRYRATRALVQRRRTSTWRPPGEAVLLRFIQAELKQGYRYYAALAGLATQFDAGDAQLRFVTGELQSRAQETERRLLALVGVVADPRIARLSHSLRDANPQVAARVLELVEQSLNDRLAALVMPFLERQSALVKAQIGVERFAVPSSFAADPLAALLSLGDEHLKLVAYVAFKGRLAGLPSLTSQEDALLRLVEKVRFLRSVPVFKELSPEDLMKLAEIATSSHHAKDTVIFREGDPGDVLCMVVSGLVAIRTGQTVIATQKPNDFFGELALFDQEPRSADAVALQETVLLEIGGADLDAVMERRPEIAREIIRVLARRLRSTTKTMVGRLASGGTDPGTAASSR
jgi:CRP/FNR family cyclic AMP-dependent transcriptional regulator